MNFTHTTTGCEDRASCPLSCTYAEYFAGSIVNVPTTLQKYDCVVIDYISIMLNCQIVGTPFVWLTSAKGI